MPTTRVLGMNSGPSQLLCFDVFGDHSYRMDLRG